MINSNYFLYCSYITSVYIQVRNFINRRRKKKWRIQNPDDEEAEEQYIIVLSSRVVLRSWGTVPRYNTVGRKKLKKGKGGQKIEVGVENYSKKCTFFLTCSFIFYCNTCLKPTFISSSKIKTFFVPKNYNVHRIVAILLVGIFILYSI